MYEKKDYEKSKSRINQTVSAIALVMMLTVTTLLASAPSVEAIDVQTYAYLAVNPNPIGVNQQVQVTMWVTPIQPVVDRFHGFVVTITKPDGTTETKGPYTSFQIGAALFAFTPTSVGNYTFKFSFPGENFSSTGQYYKPAETPPTKLIVQEQSLPPFQETPASTDYWTRPINIENTNWASISGNWLMMGYSDQYHGYGDSWAGFNPYSQAPRSAHVVWTKAIDMGGLTGGEYGSQSYFTGQAYSPQVSPPIVINGLLYYRLARANGVGGARGPGIVCVDLRTGQELWRNLTGGIDRGQLFNSQSGESDKGVAAFLWDMTGSLWDVCDAFTGNWLFSFTNASAGRSAWWVDAAVYDTDGTIRVYLIDGVNRWLACWNSTLAFSKNSINVLRPAVPPRTYDWKTGIQWNVTIPDRIVNSTSTSSTTLRPVGPERIGISDNVLLAKVSDGSNKIYWEVGYDINTGAELWAHDASVAVPSWFTALGEGKYATFSLATMQWTGYDIKTGTKLWVSDANEYPWGGYVNYGPAIAYGKLFGGSFDGYLHAFDLSSGKQVWKSSSGNAGAETVYGTWPFWGGTMIADKVVFSATGEETPSKPLTRGNSLFAFDTDSGTQLWNITGYFSLRAIADGYLVAFNGYDSRMYVFGKGPSATTVSAPQAGVSVGSPITISGTVSDQSQGQKDTPAISDADMSAWMEYLYMQKPMPTNAKGVEVTLTAIDPNGNSQIIGATTSDIGGSFGISWTPPVEGKYQIMATFGGSNSYGSSYATTYVTAGKSSAAVEPTTAPTSTAAPTTAPTSSPTTTASPSPVPNTGTGIGTEVYIAIAAAAVIAIVAAAALVLRKRK
jgi:outer membrane protein assembly factor BamB